MKKVLITGGTVFLGSYLAKRIIPLAESITIITLDIKQKITTKPNAKILKAVKGDIKFNNVNFKYIKEKTALKEINFNIKSILNSKNIMLKI